MAADPFAESADGALVRPANRILQRETRPDHGQHQVIAKIKLVPAVRDRANVVVSAPILIDRSEVGKVAGQRAFFEISRALLIAPYDVPLRISVVGVFNGPVADVWSGLGHLGIV